MLQPYSFVIKIDFENQILVSIKQKMNISQYNIVDHADGGKLIMVNSLETGTEKTFIKLHKLNGYRMQLKLWNIFCFLLN